jgi:hypothetical protein
MIITRVPAKPDALRPSRPAKRSVSQYPASSNGRKKLEGYPVRSQIVYDNELP